MGRHVRTLPLLATCLLCQTLAPTTAAAETRDKVFVTPVIGKGIKPDVLEALFDITVVSVSRANVVDVVTMDDVREQLEQEKRKDALGCSSVACATEIAGGLGVRYLLSSKVKKLGGHLYFTVSMIDTKEQRSKSGQGDCLDKEEEYQRAVASAVAEVLGIVSKSLGVEAGVPPPPVTTTTPSAMTTTVTPAVSTAGRMLWREDFNDNHLGWPTHNNEFWASEISGGQYFIETKNDKCSLESHFLPIQLPENFDVSWRTRWYRGVDNHAYGLIMGSDDKNYYTLGASGNGQTVVWSWIDDKPGPDVMGWKASTAHIGNGTAVNDHKLEVRGGYASYYTNGNLLSRFKFTVDVRAGNIGFRVCDAERASLDFIEIVDAGGGGATATTRPTTPTLTSVSAASLSALDAVSLPYLPVESCSVANDCFVTGWNYDEGKEGLTKDETRAANFYKKGCELGSNGACYNLAIDYENGIGVPQDRTVGAAYYKRACDLGHEKACYQLAVCFDNTGRGVTQDVALAAQLFQKACDKGEPKACNSLGADYEDGIGLQRDVFKAVELYDGACRAGNARACFNLGRCNEQGIGLPKNPERAAELKGKACQLEPNTKGFCPGK